MPFLCDISLFIYGRKSVPIIYYCADLHLKNKMASGLSHRCNTFWPVSVEYSWNNVHWQCKYVAYKTLTPFLANLNYEICELSVKIILEKSNRALWNALTRPMVRDRCPMPYKMAIANWESVLIDEICVPVMLVRPFVISGMKFRRKSLKTNVSSRNVEFKMASYATS